MGSLVDPMGSGSAAAIGIVYSVHGTEWINRVSGKGMNSESLELIHLQAILQAYYLLETHIALAPLYSPIMDQQLC